MIKKLFYCNINQPLYIHFSLFIEFVFVNLPIPQIVIVTPKLILSAPFTDTQSEKTESAYMHIST